MTRTRRAGSDNNNPDDFTQQEISDAARAAVKEINLREAAAARVAAAREAAARFAAARAAADARGPDPNFLSEFDN